MAISKKLIDLPADYSAESHLVAILDGNVLVHATGYEEECDECANERSYDVNIDPLYLEIQKGDPIDCLIFLEDQQMSFIEANDNMCQRCESPFGEVHAHFSNARNALSTNMPRSLNVNQMRKLADAHRNGRLYNKANDYDLHCVWWSKTNINFMTSPPPDLDLSQHSNAALAYLCNPWSFPEPEVAPPTVWSDAWKRFFQRSGEILDRWLETNDPDPPTSPPYSEFGDFDCSVAAEGLPVASMGFLTVAALPEVEKWRDEVGQALDAVPNTRPARVGSLSFRFQVLLALIASIKSANGAVVETSDAVASVGWALFPFALIFCLLYVVVKFSSLFEFIVKESMRYFETTITTLLAEVHLFNQQVCSSIPMAKMCFDRWLTVSSTYQWYGLVLQACGIGAGLLSAFTNVGFGWYNTNAMTSMFAMDKQAFTMPRRAQGYNKLGVFLSVCIAALMFIGAPVLGCAAVNKKFDPFLRLLEKLPYVTWLFDWIKSFFAGKASTSTIPTSVREFAKGEYVETDRPTAFDWSSSDDEGSFKESDHDLDSCSEYCYNMGVQCCLSESCCCTCHVVHENKQKLDVEKEELNAQAPPGVAHPKRDAYQEKVDLHQKSMTEPYESRLERTFIQLARQNPTLAHKFAKKQRSRGCKFFTDSKVHAMFQLSRAVRRVPDEKYFTAEVQAAMSILSDEYIRAHAPQGALYCNFQMADTANGRGWKCEKCGFCSQDILLRECPPPPQPFPVCNVCGQDKTKASPEGAACDHFSGGASPLPPSPPTLKTQVKPIPPVPLKSEYLRTHFVPATVSITTAEGDKAFLFAKQDEVSHVQLEPMVQDLVEDLVKQAINGKPVEEFKVCRDCNCAPCLGEQLHTECPGKKRDLSSKMVQSFEKLPVKISWWDKITALFCEFAGECHDFYMAHTSKVIVGVIGVLAILVGAAIFLTHQAGDVIEKEKGASKRSRVKHVRPPPQRGAPRKWIDSGGSEIRADDAISSDFDDNLRAAGLGLRTPSDLGSEAGYSREAFPKDKGESATEALAKLRVPASREPKDVARVSRAISHAKSYRLVVTPKEVRSFLQQRALVKESLLGHVRLENHRFIPYVFKLAYGDAVVSSATAVCDKIVVPLHAHQQGAPSVFNTCYDVTLRESDLTPIAQDLGVYFHHGAIAINKGWHMRPPGNEQVILYGFDASNDDEPTMGVGYCNAAGVYDAPSQVGNCGGPVVAATDGHLVGFHIGGGTKVNKFVPLTGELIERLKMSRSVLQASLFL